jgi:hypothetical protein
VTAGTPGTDTTAAKPDALAAIYARYREIAPDPDPESKDPSKALAISLLAHAQRDFTRMLSPAEPFNHEVIAGMCARFAAVHLLAWLRQSRPDAAARLSGEIVSAWDDGGGIGEWLWEHAQPLGVDPDAVQRLAEAEAAIQGAKRAEAEQAQAAGATQAINTLGELVESHARVMRAAMIDIGRGDPNAAWATLDQQLDGHFRDEEEKWNGSENGLQWLERMKTARQATPAGEPGMLEPSRA